MAERMATWVVWGVISWQRKFEEYGAAQRAVRWDLAIEGRRNLDNCDVRVGVMGFGGRAGRGRGGEGACAATVAGWRGARRR
jgi:phosphoglycerate dehydrogenase-like enzyme